MNIKSKRKSKALTFLESVAARPLTIGALLESLRVSDEISQVEFAKTLKISPSHLCDIEKHRKVVSPERAAHFAAILGFSPQLFIQLSLQSMIDDAGLDYKILVKAA